MLKYGDIAPQQNIGTAPSHVRCNGDGASPPSLRNDTRLSGVVLGVQNFMGQLGRFQQRGQRLGLLYGRGAHQYRAPFGVFGLNIRYDRLQFGLLGGINQVNMIVARHGAMGRNGNRLQLIDLKKLPGLRHGGARHPRQMRVHTKIVLVRDA